VRETGRFGDLLFEFGGGDRKAGAVKLLTFMSGLRLTEVDMSQAQEKKWGELTRKLEDYLIDEGIASELRLSYIPKD
jgi:hypothetical protein